tara:strand:- start:59 stop:508 length:450 start_codon:yes stop_codon:yes gene_type:complete
VTDLYQVKMHDGRHRVTFLEEIGVPTIPVILLFLDMDVLPDPLPKLVRSEGDKKIWSALPVVSDKDSLADRYFDDESLAAARKLNTDLKQGGWPPRVQRLSYTTPTNFLKLASKDNFPRPESTETVSKVFKSNIKFKTLPLLWIGKIAP